ARPGFRPTPRNGPPRRGYVRARPASPPGRRRPTPGRERRRAAPLARSAKQGLRQLGAEDEARRPAEGGPSEVPPHPPPDRPAGPPHRHGALGAPPRGAPPPPPRRGRPGATGVGEPRPSLPDGDLQALLRTPHRLDVGALGESGEVLEAWAMLPH